MLDNSTYNKFFNSEIKNDEKKQAEESCKARPISIISNSTNTMNMNNPLEYKREITNKNITIKKPEHKISEISIVKNFTQKSEDSLNNPKPDIVSIILKNPSKENESNNNKNSININIFGKKREFAYLDNLYNKTNETILEDCNLNYNNNTNHNLNNLSLMNNSYCENLNISRLEKKFDSGLNFLKSEKINMHLESREKFYSLFLESSINKLVNKKYNFKPSNTSYIRYNSKQDYFRKILLRDETSMRNFLNDNLYTKLINKENYTNMDQELRLIYLNFFALNYVFFTNKQRENIQNNILDNFLLTSELSKESKRLFCEIFFFNNSSTNKYSNNPNKPEDEGVIKQQNNENLINDYFKKKDCFSEEDFMNTIKDVNKLKNIKNYFRILVYDDMLLFLKQEVKLKIKFFLYILFQNLEKIYSNQSFLDSLFIFKYFFSNEDAETFNPDAPSNKNISNLSNGVGNSNNNNNNHRLENLIYCINNFQYQATGIKEIDANLKNLFKKKFFKIENILTLNEIYFDNIFINAELNDFFSKEEIDFFEKAILRIGFFYKKKFTKKQERLSLISPGIRDFTFQFIELLNFKSLNKFNMKVVYMQLEKEIQQSYEKSGFMNALFNEGKFLTNFLYKKHQYVYKTLSDVLESFLKGKNSLTACLFPFGSITQFLGSKDTDLDLYLDIQSSEPEDKEHFIIDFFFYLKKNAGIDPIKCIISKRLLTFTFEHKANEKGDKIKVDINFSSFFGVLNSSLLRFYTQLDQRFAILAVYVKKKLQELKLKNENNNKINNFSWTLILLTFLQDVVHPPVLPKVLSYVKDANKVIRIYERICKTISKKTWQNTRNNYIDKETVKQFFHNTQQTEHEIPDFLDFLQDEKKVQEIFQQNKAPLNTMSLSELYIAFLEFVIFYYKFDSNFLYCSGLEKAEGFYGKSRLKYDFEDINDNFKLNTLLIRDPIDKKYNPTEMVGDDAIKEIKSVLKKHYSELMTAK